MRDERGIWSGSNLFVAQKISESSCECKMGAGAKVACYARCCQFNMEKLESLIQIPAARETLEVVPNNLGATLFSQSVGETLEASELTSEGISSAAGPLVQQEDAGLLQLGTGALSSMCTS